MSVPRQFRVVVGVLLMLSRSSLSRISLKDDDLAGRMGLQVKELNKLMAGLEKDRLVKV